MIDSPAVNIVNTIVHQWSLELMGRLLIDRTTRKNIIWADDEYCELGDGYQPYDQITLNAITGFHSSVIKTRIMKDAEQQVGRTRRKAEVFTPSWLCNQMNNALDEEWFGRRDVFNIETEDGWETSLEHIQFEDVRGRRWKDYVDCRKLEITCGEAPFLCSRYDTTNGNVIPVKDRIGILDRKLRIVTENVDSYDEWLKWAYRALESSYGYEYQGDNLIVARINMLMTFAEHMNDRWGQMPDEKEAAKAVSIITWNIWQMDGLRGCVPSEWDVPEEENPQHCMVYDWRAGASQTWESLKG